MAQRQGTQVGNMAKQVVLNNINDVRNHLHRLLIKHAHSRYINKSKVETSDITKTGKHVRGSSEHDTEMLDAIKSKLRSIRNNIEYHGSVIAAYDKFSDVETLYNDYIPKAGQKFHLEFKKIMENFKAFLIQVLTKNSDNKDNRNAIQQTAAIIDDIQYYENNNIFPDSKEIHIARSHDKLKRYYELRNTNNEINNEFAKIKNGRTNQEKKVLTI